MVDAVVGSVIMVVATTSLLYAIEVAERAFDQAGRYPLNPEERVLLEDSVDMRGDALTEFWTTNLVNAPREVGKLD